MTTAPILKVLLVDDDEESYLIVRHLLSTIEQWSFHVDWVATYEEGLDRVAQQEHDICLIDFRLDGRNGLDLLREAVEAGTRAPMIMLTGLGDREVDLQAMRAGAADYLGKDGLTGEMLERSIRYALERRRLHDKLEERAARLHALAGQLNRAEQRERSRIARLLHDHFQQILVAAKMRVENLSRQHPSDDLRQLRDLLDEMLEASRTLTIELSPPILLDAGLAAALNWLSRWMQERHKLRVIAEVDPEADPATDYIRLMLFHAVRELLFNVVKHAEIDEVRLTMNREGDDVRITVEDAGVGFDPAALAGKSSRSEFGLLSLRERVQLVGGTVEVDTAPGQGTRVTIQCSRQPFPEPSVAAGAAGPMPVEPGRPIRVLLADDHVVVREGLASSLTTQPDIDVIGEAGDGEEAIEMARQLRPDVIVMDVVMPGLSGVDATRQIVQEMPHVRVIGLSMYSDEEMAQMMRRAGALAYLSKGGPIGDLVEQIRKAYAEAHAVGDTDGDSAE